ncbi:hypothetical protein HII36_27940 [Nonomuraea sp. NN258]|uniref:hypothetical protein n=1 Tax=Nonomuraea antri TaxID=2730852 RepID=UPI00156A5B6C|nr:hypothetical protein [Nonomuraea antri]NRQ35637.1 hypothetical protein [Nonomuraea antri]
MKRGLRIIVCGLLAGALAGCGGGGAESFLDPHAVIQLREVLNKGPSLPDGFSDRPGQAWQAPFGRVDKNCGAVLGPAGGRAPERALTAQAAVTYQGDRLGEQAAVGLARYAGDEVEGHLDTIAKALRACHAVRSEDGTDLRLHVVPIADTGDEALAGQLRGRLNGYPYALDVVLSRVEDTLVSVVHTGMSEIDPARTRKLVDAVIGMANA